MTPTKIGTETEPEMFSPSQVGTSVGVHHQQKEEETKTATHLDQDFLSLIFRSVANPQLGWAKQMFFFWRRPMKKPWDGENSP